MKFRVTMKTPDCLDDVIDEAVERDFGGARYVDDSNIISFDEEEDPKKDQIEEIQTLCRRWFKYDEHVASNAPR